MLTKQAINNIKKEIDETKKTESKPASITNIYHNVPNAFNPGFDKPRKSNFLINLVENEKLFEDKLEVYGNKTFPSFAQIHNNETNNKTSKLKKKIEGVNQNIKENLLNEVKLYVNGKSKYNKTQIEKVNKY